VVVEEITGMEVVEAGGGTAIEVIPFPSGTNVPVTIGRSRRLKRQSNWRQVVLHHLVLTVQLQVEQVELGGPAPVGSGQGGLGGSGSGGT
jgi:hypothetical protein